MKCIAVTVLFGLFAVSYAVAMERPPTPPSAARSWLCDNLRMDMEQTNSIAANAFGKTEFSAVAAVKNPRAQKERRLDDRQVAWLAFY
jgi:hypothetical protein